MKALMLVLLAAAILISGAITSVQAEDTFYIVYDKTMHGCTIATTEPSDKSRYKTEGRYKTESEVESNHLDKGMLSGCSVFKMATPIAGEPGESLRA